MVIFKDWKANNAAIQKYICPFNNAVNGKGQKSNYEKIILG